MPPRVIYWFRTDLRLHDSPALNAALGLTPEVLWPLWTWDPHYVYETRVGPNRWNFLIECQNDLSQSITKLNPNSKLFVIREAPQTLFPKLFRAWRVSHLIFEKDTDAYARDRDEAVIAAARNAGVQVIVKSGRTLWDSDVLVQNNGGKPTMSIRQVQVAGLKAGDIPRPLDAPTWLPDPGEIHLRFEAEVPVVGIDWNEGGRVGGDRSYEALAGPTGDFAVPTLEELGFPAATTPHRGGETVALQDLDRIISDELYTATFEKPKTAPTAFKPQSTTLLSPHLHFGSLSVRLFYWRVQDVISSFKKGTASTPPVSLTGQLLFRDMYFGAQAALGHSFGQTKNNPTAHFIPWHLPTLIDPLTRRRTNNPKTRPYIIDDPSAEIRFQRWRNGRTGFPWIDALMRQLRLEGWIHHLGRHAVACFLTRGGCYISWERGADVFEEWLIDHETACNAGNWQWLSCTAFFSQFFRVYSPVAFGQKWDPEGTFVRKYVPELGKLGRKWIYEPWKAPKIELEAAGVRLIGEREEGWDRLMDGRGERGVYPRPLFDFADMRGKCLDGMKEAYKLGLRGDDARVLDESYRTLFADGGVGDVGAPHGDGTAIKAAGGPFKKPGKNLANPNHRHSHGTEDALVDNQEGSGIDDEDCGGEANISDDPNKQRKRTRAQITNHPRTIANGNTAGDGESRGKKGSSKLEGAQATLNSYIIKKKRT